MSTIFRVSKISLINILFIVFLIYNKLFLFINCRPNIHVFDNVNLEGNKLIFVQAVWRHGDRAPIYIYPNDPNKEDAWPQRFSELTTIGMAQHFYLGKFLGKRYIDELNFLSPQYKSEEIYVISTDTNRTIQSAISNMIGMFGQRERLGIDYPNVVGWPPAFLPIPIHNYEFKKDPIGYARHNCKRTIELFKLLEKTPEYKKLNQSNAEFLTKISEYAGTQITLNNLWGFIETANIEKTHGLIPPEWVVQILPEALKIDIQLINLQMGLGIKLEPFFPFISGIAPFMGINFESEIPRMLGGPFLWELIERMEKKASE